MAKYRVHLTGTCHIVIEVEADDAAEAVSDGWDQAQTTTPEQLVRFAAGYTQNITEVNAVPDLTVDPDRVGAIVAIPATHLARHPSGMVGRNKYITADQVDEYIAYGFAIEEV